MSNKGKRYRPSGNIWFSEAHKRWVFTARDGRMVTWSRAVMGNHIGRPLTAEEHVHHINGDSTDDSISNLLIVSPSGHRRIHNDAREPKYTREYMIQHIRNLYDNGIYPGQHVLNQRPGPGNTCYQHEFGGLRAARRLAGIPENPRWVGYTPDFLLEHLRSLQAQFGKVTYDLVDAAVGPSTAPYLKTFGTFTKAKALAGIGGA